MLEEVAVDCRNNATASNELRSFKTNRLFFAYAKVTQQVLQHNFYLNIQLSTRQTQHNFNMFIIWGRN